VTTRRRTDAPAADWKLWHNPALAPKMGCLECPDRPVCGGLHIAAGVFDCGGLCACARGAKRCSGVCRNNPRDFVARVAEVGGFALDNVPRCAPLTWPDVPDYVPVIYDGTSRRGGLAAGTVAVPLMALFNRRSGTGRCDTADDVLAHFRLAAGTRIIVTGVAADGALEAWWSFSDRPRLIALLLALGVEMVTAPNYSSFTDVTRYDNLHNLKRIALATAEFIAGGLPCAFHINGRTDRDYERLCDYVAEREEIAAVAFEFATGAAGMRGQHHLEQLLGLAAKAGRPLRLVVRGGRPYLPQLAAAFASVSVLDTEPYVKTKYRQRARCAPCGEMEWFESPTPSGAPLDDLLAHNVECARRSAALRANGIHADHADAEAAHVGALLKSRPA
jgi:hypothetical protein